MTELWFINEFHIQVLAFALMVSWRYERRERFLARFLPLAAVYCALPRLVEGSYFAPFLCIGWFTFGFPLMLILCGALLGFSFRMRFHQVVFVCCVAHTLQHLTHCLSRMLSLLFSLGSAGTNSVELGIALCLVLAQYLVLKGHFAAGDDFNMKRGELLAFAAVSSMIVYCVSLWASSVEGESIGKHLFDIFCCLLLLVILLDAFQLRRSEREQLMLLRLLRQEQEQHELSRATMDVINRKCHDLRHQITALRHMKSEERERSIGEMEKAVLIYDSFPKTGNDDVDIILAEKSLLAEKEHIALRCMVDGAALAFLRVEDLYSLLGNALDNALEATRKEEDEARRIITLFAAPRGDMLSIHIENPCPVKPAFEGGLPLTDKPDTDWHGFGMRSMRFLCEKYGGVLTAGWESGVFSLNMLFPGRPGGNAQPLTQGI